MAVDRREPMNLCMNCKFFNMRSIREYGTDHCAAFGTQEPVHGVWTYPRCENVRAKTGKYAKMCGPFGLAFKFIFSEPVTMVPK